MNFYAYEGLCLAGEEAPDGARKVSSPFAPLVFLTRIESHDAYGIRAMRELSELHEPEGIAALLPSQISEGALAAFVHENGACRVNTAYRRWLRVLQSYRRAKPESLRLTVVGLGDVGGTVLLGLKLLAGKTVSELRIYDPNEALCSRYELELNQVLPYEDRPQPRITVCRREELFDCDALLFTASRGVPPVGESGTDVRLVQLEKNREMLKSYAETAKKAGFTGLFCQIADPVDLLSRSFLWQSGGDFDGLLPEQIQGYGLGVMAARAAYYAGRQGVDFTRGRLYGPHGSGLIVANAAEEYDGALSEKLTEQTVTANLRVRELGYKPYLAPGLSSACVSVLQTLTGQWHYSAIPLGGVYFGCRSRLTSYGVETERLPLAPALQGRIEKSMQALREKETVCRL